MILRAVWKTLFGTKFSKLSISAMVAMVIPSNAIDHYFMFNLINNT